MVVLEHVGSRLSVKQGAFLGRIVAVSRNRSQLEEDIRQVILMLQQTIAVPGQTFSTEDKPT